MDLLLIALVAVGLLRLLRAIGLSVNTALVVSVIVALGAWLALPTLLETLFTLPLIVLLIVACFLFGVITLGNVIVRIIKTQQ